MTDFSNAQVGPIQNYVTPKEGVAMDYSGLASAASGLFAGLKAKAVGAQDQFLADFSSKQLALAEAVDQDAMSSRAARSRMRANFLNAINNAPGLQKELLELQKSIMSTSALGKVVAEGTDAEKRQAAIDNDLVTKGYVKPDAKEDEFEAARNNYVLAQEAERRLGAELKTIELEKSQLGLSQAKQDALNARQKEAVLKYSRDTLPARAKQFQTSLNQILEASGEAGSKAEQIEKLWGDFNNEIAELRTYIDTTDADALVTPFKLYYEAALKRASGEYSLAELQNANKTALELEKALMMENPALRRAVAASSLIPNLAPDQIPLLNNIVSDFIAGNAVEEGDPANLFSDKKSQETYLDILEGVMGQDGLGETESEELAVHITNILEGVVDFEGLIAKDALRAEPLINFFSSKKFYDYLQQNDFTMSPAGLDNVREILTRNYADEVWGMVQREFTNNKVKIENPVRSRAEAGGEIPTMPNTPDVIGVRTTKSGVEFFATKSVAGVDRDIARKVTKLNRELAPVINKTVRAFSHLQGRTDYGKFAEENLQRIMDPNFTGGDDNLTSDDFLEKTVPQIRELIDATETGGTADYDTLLGFSQKPGKAFEGVRVTNMSIDEAIQFSRGDYADYSRELVGRVATPMGRYQIVGSTLRSLKKEMGLTGSEKFDEDMQDAMFQTLVDRRVKPGMKPSQIVAALRSEWEGLKNVPSQKILEALDL